MLSVLTDDGVQEGFLVEQKMEMPLPLVVKDVQTKRGQKTRMKSD